jgi:hypothetical protein
MSIYYLLNSLLILQNSYNNSITLAHINIISTTISSLKDHTIQCRTGSICNSSNHDSISMLWGEEVMYRERIKEKTKERTGYAEREKGNGIMSPCSTHEKEGSVVKKRGKKGGKKGVLYNRVVV